jgi:8-oxo-dGTP diphosphatase
MGEGGLPITPTTPQIPTTHAVAVTGYVLSQGRFLLLKRSQPPLIWAPPAGRLNLYEDPSQGVVREIREETGLVVHVLGLIDYWFGEIGNYGKLLSLDFMTLSSQQAVALSQEHEDFTWATLSDLENGNPPLGNDPCSYCLTDFQKVANEWKKFQYLMPAH